MSSEGIYSEKLPCGGTLNVARHHWNIQYYFPGPDLRYNGEIVTISGTDVARYSEGFRTNWNDYKQLQDVIPSGEYVKPGAAGMSIRVGGHFAGVCLKSHYMPVRTESDLTRVLESYKYAAKRAEQVQSLIFGL